MPKAGNHPGSILHITFTTYPHLHITRLQNMRYPMGGTARMHLADSIAAVYTYHSSIASDYFYDIMHGTTGVPVPVSVFFSPTRFPTGSHIAYVHSALISGGIRSNDLIMVMVCNGPAWSIDVYNGGHHCLFLERGRALYSGHLFLSIFSPALNSSILAPIGVCSHNDTRICDSVSSLLDRRNGRGGSVF
jgi:hypothetical protein